MEVKAKENGEKEVKNIKVTETENKEKEKKADTENKTKDVEIKEVKNEVSSPIFGSEINYII
jgi:hypothetical protein